MRVPDTRSPINQATLLNSIKRPSHRTCSTGWAVLLCPRQTHNCVLLAAGSITLAPSPHYVTKVTKPAHFAVRGLSHAHAIIPAPDLSCCFLHRWPVTGPDIRHGRYLPRVVHPDARDSMSLSSRIATPLFLVFANHDRVAADSAPRHVRGVCPALLVNDSVVEDCGLEVLPHHAVSPLGPATHGEDRSHQRENEAGGPCHEFKPVFQRVDARQSETPADLQEQLTNHANSSTPLEDRFGAFTGVNHRDEG